MSYRDDAREDRSVVVFGLEGRVFGLDRDDGTKRFEHDVGHGEVEVLIGSDRIFAHCAWGKLHCFHYPTGAPLGSAMLPGNYDGRPTMLLDGDRLYICTGGEVTCVGLDGAVLWHEPMHGKGVGSMSIAVPGRARQADDIGSK